MTTHTTIFDARIEQASAELRNSSAGRYSLYWDALDGENYVVGVERLDAPVPVPDPTDGDTSLLLWPDDGIRDFYGMLREWAGELVGALEGDTGEEWTAHTSELFDWDVDGDEIECGRDDGRDIKCITCQVYRAN